MPYTSQDVGWQRTDTSHDAAKTTDAANIRKKVLWILGRAEIPLTSEEIAAGLGLPYRSVQPRLSELRDLGLVEDSGERGVSTYNKSVIKWGLVDD